MGIPITDPIGMQAVGKPAWATEKKEERAYTDPQAVSVISNSGRAGSKPQRQDLS